MKSSISTGEAVFSVSGCRLLRGQNDDRWQNKAQPTDAMGAFHGLHLNRWYKFGWMIGVTSPYHSLTSILAKQRRIVVLSPVFANDQNA